MPLCALPSALKRFYIRRRWKWRSGRQGRMGLRCKWDWRRKASGPIFWYHSRRDSGWWFSREGTGWVSVQRRNRTWWSLVRKWAGNMMVLGCYWHWWGWVGGRGAYRVTCDRQRYPTFNMVEQNELWINCAKVHGCHINKHKQVMFVRLTCRCWVRVTVWLQVVFIIIILILLRVVCTKRCF